MDKEREACEALLHVIDECSKGFEPASGPYQVQIQLLRNIQLATIDGHGIRVEELEQLLAATATTERENLLVAWLTWLNELLVSKKLELLGDIHRLVEYLLLRVEQLRPAELTFLVTLLKVIPGTELRHYWPRVAILKQPMSVETSWLLMLCQDVIFMELDLESDVDTLPLADQLADNLLQPQFEGRWLQSQAEEVPIQLTQTFQLLVKIISLRPDYAEEHASRLMGFILANLQYGSEQRLLPWRVQPAQQSHVHVQGDDEPGSSNNNSKNNQGGRRTKARKMRSLTKQKASQQVDNQVETALTSPRDRLLLQGNLDYGCRTGDSEGFTPSETELAHPEQRQIHHLQAKVRVAALQLLSALAKQLPRRQLYGYWHAIFPSDTERRDNLLAMGQLDGNPRCRAMALQVAAQLLYGSKMYLNQASAKGPSNYTPFAVSLASAVMCAYRNLSTILQREYVPPVLTQCLKCLAVLVQATPFEQLEMGFVYEFVPYVKKLAKHNDTPVAVSALLVMEMLVATPKLTQEMACAVGLATTRPLPTEQPYESELKEFCDSDEEEEIEASEEDRLGEQMKTLEQPVPVPPIPRNSWLLRQVLRYLETSSTTPPLRLECLQVIMAMATHFALLQLHLIRLSRVIASCLQDPSQDVRLYAARCLDTLGYQMARYCQDQQSSEQEQHLAFWLRLLPFIYAAYMNEASASLKCSLCDALANMGSNSFDRLPRPQRNGLLAFLSGCSSDDAEEHLVRSAALRALAVYVLHPSLRSDLVFIENAAESTLRLTDNTQLAVRIKAAWALGNISDALLVASVQTERISDDLLGRLIVAATKACSDHDKVRANAVRSLGNLLQLLPPQAEREGALIKLLDCVRNAGSAKVKWNACYALGNLVKNRALFTTPSSCVQMSNLLFPTLSQLIVQHGNFKVRINATAVLLQVEQRSDFGSHYTEVWRSLLAATERSNALDSYEEYNHRDALQQQLCLAMAHLLNMARSDDLPACRSALVDHLDVVTSTWRRVAYRIIAEQAAPLFTCSSLLTKRMHSNPLTSLSGEQRSALDYISDALRLES
ncbi:uncharacterized protein Dwil_GK19879 [Drosophila willistoni]|uniref:HEAT repeat-containing protein 6 n=1 Tax=Drosophila willistoni TaxID=7260 RepID=B4MSL8_DROWI|nr:HEAT repeat-containing protein 6 [Drosophila willistoni]EDW75107.1 uncharacterized protein Dwil_GK19879 [Drosophila willistoni]